MTTPATTDLCDAHEDRLDAGRLRVLAPGLRHFGRARRFCGRAVTLKLFEDNSFVRTALEAPGNGAVLVVDGGGSMRCALVGGNLGVLAEKNGLRILDAFGIEQGQVVRRWPNLLASTAVFKFDRRSAARGRPSQHLSSSTPDGSSLIHPPVR